MSYNPSKVVIDISQLQQNAEIIKEKIGSRKILAVVKANAYGHGAVPVAQALLAQVDYFGVATLAEALELRNNGISKPILKFGPLISLAEAELAVAAEVEITVVDLESLRLIDQAVKTQKRKAKVHLKIDLGMGRVGVSATQAVLVAQELAQNPTVELVGVYGHLPCADMDSARELTLTQIADFTRLTTEITGRIGYQPIRHLAASFGIAAYPESYFDMVRPGISLYGALCDAQFAESFPVRPALTWLAPVNFVKKVTKDTAIGYGGTWIASEDSWIATISVGYADGYSRLLSNCGEVAINGQCYPVVGRVCMDQIMVNLGTETEVKAGDEAVLLNPQGRPSVCHLAELSQTISYETFCAISPRVRRHYLETKRSQSD